MWSHYTRLKLWSRQLFFCFAVCPHLILSETSGVITSPNFPLNYPENQICSWQIIARKGKRVKLVIQSLEIQYCRACSCDYLEIENASFADGTPNKKRECGVFFGNITYYSQQDRLRVLFVSDSSQRARGFTAVYTQVAYNTSNGMFGGGVPATSSLSAEVPRVSWSSLFFDFYCSYKHN